MRFRSLLLVSSLVLFACTGEQKEIGGPPAADLSPEQLLERTLQRYENATRYRDTAAIRRTLRVIDTGVPQPFENQLDYATVSFD
jgi:hypothetical protein